MPYPALSLNEPGVTGPGVVEPGVAEPGMRRAVRGGILGNYVDQFDIFLPIIALAPAAAHLFGPENLVSNAGLIFVATLLGRPLGAAIFGPISDRVGRTVTTKAALAGIAVTMLLIAAVPSHAVLGTGTLAIILVLRLLGGIFLGGEYTSAIPLAMEWSEPRRRGLASGLIMWMSPWANATIAGIVFVLLSTLDSETYSAWGWRIPFLLGSVMAFGMLIYYRSYIAEAPAWKQPASRTNPLRDLLRGEHRGALLQVFTLMSGLWLFTYMAIPVLTGQLKVDAHLSAQTISFLMMCATAASAFGMVGCGHLSTFIGRRTFFIGFGLIAAVLAPITYLAVFAARGTTGLVLVVTALQLVTVSGYGPVGAYLAERFPAAVRSSGYGMSYSLSIVLPALYPYYLPPLQNVFGDHAAIAILLVVAGLLVLTGALTGPETSKTRQLE
jgi:MFS family permease